MAFWVMYLTALQAPPHIRSGIREIQKELTAKYDFYPAFYLEILLPLFFTDVPLKSDVSRIRDLQTFSAGLLFRNSGHLYLEVIGAGQDRIAAGLPEHIESHRNPPFPQAGGFYLGWTSDDRKTEAAIPELCWNKMNLIHLLLETQSDRTSETFTSSLLWERPFIC